MFSLVFSSYFFTACSKTEEVKETVITYSGGNGHSYAKAVIINGAQNHSEAVQAIRDWLTEHYPKYGRGRQYPSSANGKDYTLFEMFDEGGGKLYLFFDTTNFADLR